MPPSTVNRSKSLPDRLKRSTSISYGAHIDDFSVYHNNYEEFYPDPTEIQTTLQKHDIQPRLPASLQIQRLQYPKSSVRRKPLRDLGQIDEGVRTDIDTDTSSGYSFLASRNGSAASRPNFDHKRIGSSTGTLRIKRFLSRNTRDTSWHYLAEEHSTLNLQLTDFGSSLESSNPTDSLLDKKDWSNLVAWGENDPLNPKNWSNARKWTAVLIVSAFNLITPISSSMVAPALPQIGRDLNLKSSGEEALVLSIFILAYAVGPLIFSPLSEVYGRVPVLQLANLFYLVTNLICGFAKSKGVLLFFRFCAGIGGSAPLAIGGAVIADLFRPDERGRAVSLYTLGPLLGPAIGPIAGAFIAANASWRWAFWSTSIVDSLIQVLAILFLRESYPPLILERKAAALRQETGNQDLHTEFDTPSRTTKNVLKVALVRPFKLMWSQATIQFLGIFMAFIYGLIYLLLSTFPTVWTEKYEQSIEIGGLNYIAIGLGFFIGTIFCANVNERVYRRLKAANNDVGRAEFRIPMMIPGTLLVPIGLFWYGWSVQARIHWIMPDIGVLIFSIGTIICFQCIQTYIVDTYSRYAASAMAAIMVLRSLAGFGFPLFAPAMYEALGDGWGNSLLAFFCMAIGTPAALVLWFYGQKLRERSQFAVGE